MIKTEFYVSQTFQVEVVKKIRTLLLFLFLAINILIFLPFFLNDCFLKDIIYSSFSLVCHQNKELSFSVTSSSLPVCSRCTGIYQSLLFSSIIFSYFFKKTISRSYFNYFLGIIIFIFVISKVSQTTSLNINTVNFFRWISGVFIGIILSYTIYYKGHYNE